ncbi:hypothetical protein ASJ81_04380 [Methanosarcina spelaei]|uniref:eCIS core domain-containing protein n=1 Tax=Methanosarcina spelaei TaxID=1036679 RepID=A0A2A2HU09_9EURY|nr:DUF4157 domain-containing protein [Methanosarcina spelaei]PAV12969.1 hypothetical protein ASJ81_04380 [Methanosarcina spelaei]
MPEHQQIQQSKKPDTSFQKQAIPIIQIPLSNPYSIIQRARINPKYLTHADVMQLQRTIGNRAVAQLISGIVNSSTVHEAFIQRSEIPEEEEPLQGKMVGTVQRQEIPEEEELPMQGKFEGIQRQEIPEEEEPLQGKFEDKPEIACNSCFAAPIVQRQEIPEDEEPLQGKTIETVQRQEIPEEEEPLQGKFESVQRQEIPQEKEPLQTKRENNTGMSDNLKAGVESLSGIDMSDVRVHYNSDKPAEVGALAYTQGINIHIAPGQERHLPHEAWHVVQQAQGRVQLTMQLKEIAMNDDVGLEKEADQMGRRAEGQFRMRSFETVQRQLGKLLINRTVEKNSRVLQCCRRDLLIQDLDAFTKIHTWKYNGNLVDVGRNGLGDLVARDPQDEIAFIQYKVNDKYLEISGFGNSFRRHSPQKEYPGAGTMLLKELLELTRTQVNFVKIVRMSGSYGYYRKLGFDVPEKLAVEDTRQKNPDQIKREENMKLLKWRREASANEQQLIEPVVGIGTIEANVNRLLAGRGWQKIN